MHDDEAATGVAYEVHDAPALERSAVMTADEQDPAAPRERLSPALVRRFTRRSAPVEPMS
jgi:hypothetical protein